MALTREVPLKQGQCALLVVDMQKQFAIASEGSHSDVDPEDSYLFTRIKSSTIPAIQKLLSAFRKSRSEVIYTFIECLTKDGRDQSLDYKISGILVPKGHPGAKMIDELAPEEDDILIPKTSCSVFCSTNIEYVLRNLGVQQLVIVGMITNQCVESAVRDAADKGFLVTVVDEACAADSQREHDSGLWNMKGFARFKTAAQIEAELESFNS